MKNLYLFLAITTAFCLINIEVLHSQTYSELMDSTVYYQRNQDFDNALKWAKLALIESEKTSGKTDSTYTLAMSKVAFLFFNLGKADSALFYEEANLKILRSKFKGPNEELVIVISDLGAMYHQAGFPDKAEPLFTEALEMSQKLYKGDNIDLAMCLNNLASFYQQRGKYKEAEPMLREAYEMLKRIYIDNNPDLAQLANNMGTLYAQIGKYPEAEKFFIESLEMKRRMYKGDHPDLALSLINLGTFYNEHGEFPKAEPLFVESLKMYRNLFKEDHPDLAQTISEVAGFYQTIGKFKEAEPLFLEGFEMMKRIFKGDHPALANSIIYLGMFYKAAGKYKEAEQYFKDALAMRIRFFKSDHPDIANSYVHLATIYQEVGNYSEAEHLFKDALNMRKRLYKGDHIEVLNSMSNLAGFYNEIGKYHLAEPLLIEGLAIARRIFKENGVQLEVVVNNIGYLYNALGNYSAAEAFFKEGLEIKRRTYKTDHPSVSASLNNMAMFYYGVGDYKDAEPLFRECLEMKQRLYKSDHQDLAYSLTNTGDFYRSTGNLTEAEKYIKNALEMYRRLNDKDHQELASSIGNMASFLNDIGKTKEAEPLYKEAAEMMSRIFKEDNPLLAVSIQNLGLFYQNHGKLKEAEELLQKSYEMLNRIFPGDNPKISTSSMNLAKLKYQQSKFQESEILYKNSIDMNRRLFKTEHPDLAKSLNNLGWFYTNQNKTNQAEPLFKESLGIYNKIISNYFPSLSDREKEKFWKVYFNYFEGFNSFAIKRISQNPAITCDMYDNQLATKALLFNSSNKIKKRILSSKDSVLINDYNNLITQKERLVKIYTLTKTELDKKGINLDSLESIVNELDKKISLKSEIYKQSYESKKIDWRSIQFALKPDEAAIELVRFRYVENNRWTDTVYYAALIVTDQTTDHPDLILLENGQDLEKKFYTDYRKKIKNVTEDKESFNNFWTKIYEKTKQFKRIYFSPDGIFNKVNISTFKLPDGRFLLDMQEIQQVNSTKDLLLSFYMRHDESQTFNNAVLFGNPKFELNEGSKENKNAENLAERAAGIVSLENLRNIKLEELPGTEKEILSIEAFLKSKKWDVQRFIKNEALKTNVKNVNNPRVLHIATHGFFLPDLDTSSDSRTGSNPLFKTGLFFAGASSKNTDQNLDQGLLSAYEAMNLNLDKTELVVLSACETGLGEIRNGEGVFGLRRAFQQAGAKSVLMSLWNVSDDATQELMTLFYQEWLSGKSKREAFASAQQKIKDKYKEPYFWGAFVMVGE